MTLPMFDWPPIYLVDASAFRSLHNCHGGCPPETEERFSQAEQDAIWGLLNHLGEDGRIRVVNQVFRELDGRCPSSHSRGKAIPNHRPEARFDGLIRMYQEITGKHDRMVRRMDAEPADPWILAWARIMISRGVKVVTEELPLAEAKNNAARRRKLHFGLPLPDLCDEYHVKWVSLDGLLSAEAPELLRD
ncbi:MAG: DUF4411 family protein [Dehalococcoidia bacterium]